MGMIRTAQEVVKMKKKYASGVLLSAALLMIGNKIEVDVRRIYA